MFNINEVKSSFTDDKYGFTASLLSYINDLNKIPSKKLAASIDDLLFEAYEKSSVEAQRVVQNALFMIYQTNLSNPLSNPAKVQHDETLCLLRKKIEEKWLGDEFKNIKPQKEPPDEGNFAKFLITVWQEHRASHHELFDFLENEATSEQLYLFFKSDSALNLIFFDLVAYTLIGSQPETRGTISENLWDEIGHGDNYFTHVNLYKNVLERRDISLPDNHYIDLYGVDALAGHNAFMLGAINRSHYYKLLGVMAMTEVLDPPQYTKLVKGCMRLGLLDKDVHYYSEHITIDIKHGDDWLYNVINVITDAHPESKNEFYLGSLLRLQTAERYYDNLMKEMKKIAK
ncbi:iron-containing redox enzyme family protein [Pectobacterium aroidearum]|uniref:iron-containing redox enzyme family protein n=1 Tax=Pectobacterium aroidearum TaxID=1201031 RepID=UPI003306CD59